MRSVPVGDPVIKEAAEHALKGLNDRSNSLVPYELRQVMTAHAEVSQVFKPCCLLVFTRTRSHS